MFKGLNHVGISVVDMDRSIDFYCRLMGMKLVVRARFDGEDYESIMQLAGAAGEAALVKLPGTGLQLEFFQFDNPRPKTAAADRPVSDHGISHFCVEVSDLDAEHERLKAAGVVFHCPPLNFKSGNKATYARDPDGNVFELWEKGKKQGKQ